MRCLLLVKFEAFTLQLYYQPNSSTGIVIGCLHFMLIVRQVNRRETL